MRAMSSPTWPAVRNHSAYLHRCVLNEARRLHRDNGRRRSREARAAVAAGPGVVLPPDVRPEVLAAVSVLSMRQRAVVFSVELGSGLASEQE